MIEDDGINEEAFKGFGDDPAPVTPPADDPGTPPVDPPKEDDKPPVESKKDDDEKAPVDPPKEDEEKKPEGDEEPPKAPDTPPAEPPKDDEPVQPLTKEDVTSVISELLEKERTSGKELETTTDEVIEAYYPDGLSNVLVDEQSGKELRTPQDVVDVSGGEMSIEAAAKWLMNEQYKLDNTVAKIKDDARTIAETTVKFKRDSVAVLQKYDPLFKAYPQLQGKVWSKLMKQVKADKDKGVVLSAPDVQEYYDDYLEPYQQAFEHSTQQPATNPAPPPPEPPKPTTDDRLDESGDGGTTAPNDPNDFAQQVSKELAKGSF